MTVEDCAGGHCSIVWIFRRGGDGGGWTQLGQRADGLYSIERVPARLRDHHLATARRYGVPSQEYRKLTFDKTLQQRAEHQDAILLSPGHPLFVALSEVLLADLEPVKGHAAIFVDPRASESYQVHFFEVQIVSEEPVADTRRDG